MGERLNSWLCFWMKTGVVCVYDDLNRIEIKLPTGIAQRQVELPEKAKKNAWEGAEACFGQNPRELPQTGSELVREDFFSVMTLQRSRLPCLVEFAVDGRDRFQLIVGCVPVLVTATLSAALSRRFRLCRIR